MLTSKGFQPKMKTYMALKQYTVFCTTVPS
jgi:hypothetical protein